MRRFRVVIVVVTSAVAAAVVIALVVAHGSRPTKATRITVTVDGRARSVAPDARLGSLGLRPRAGDLVDVHGRVLRIGIFPGSVLVDGRARGPRARLAAGDRIVVRRGADRREPVRRRRVPVLEGMPPDVEFRVSRVPSVAVVAHGAISNSIVSTRVHATGPAVVSGGVALTFDDGPSPVYTPRVLAVLKRLDAPATFFAVGYLADAYPELVRAELAAGMEVGNHTYNHPEVPPFGQLPAPLRDAEIRLGAQSIRRAGGDPYLLRPPGGSYSAAVARAAARERERIVLWSVDPGDWHQGITAAQIARRVLDAVEPGSIVLLHDGGGDRSATVAALPAIVNGIRRRGLQLVLP